MTCPNLLDRWPITLSNTHDACYLYPKNTSHILQCDKFTFSNPVSMPRRRYPVSTTYSSTAHTVFSFLCTATRRRTYQKVCSELCITNHFDVVDAGGGLSSSAVVVVINHLRFQVQCFFYIHVDELEIHHFTACLLRHRVLYIKEYYISLPSNA